MVILEKRYTCKVLPDIRYLINCYKDNNATRERRMSGGVGGKWKGRGKERRGGKEKGGGEERNVDILNVV